MPLTARVVARRKKPFVREAAVTFPTAAAAQAAAALRTVDIGGTLLRLELGGA